MAVTPRKPRLTPNQEAVLRLVGQGKTLAEIAAELGMPVRTAKYHADNLRRIAGVERKRHLIAYSREYFGSRASRPQGERAS